MVILLFPSLKSRGFHLLSWGKYSSLDEVQKNTLGSYAEMLFDHICEGNDRVAKRLRYVSILGIEMDIFEFSSQT